MIKLTHYFYVLSTWCLAAEGALTEIREQFGDALSYDWKIAVTDYGGDGPMRLEDLKFY